MTAKRKHRKSKKESPIDGLMRQIRQSGLLEDNEITFQLNEGPKLSSVLLDFIEPFEEFAQTDEAYRKLITLAVVAWNAAILSNFKRKELIDITINSIVRMAGEEWRKDAENTLAILIKRKERYFAADKRLIVDYRLTEIKGEYHLSVASVEKK